NVETQVFPKREEEEEEEMDWPRTRVTAQHLLGITLFLVTGLALTGCGSDTQQPTTTSPSVSSISPAGTSVGAAPLTLNVKGSNSEQGSTVNWNGNSRTSTFVSSTQLQAHIMAADLANVGKTPVTVTNPEGGASNAVQFTIAAATITFQSSRALDGTDAP